MKLYLNAFILAMLLLACAGQKNANGSNEQSVDDGTKVFCYKDSCQHLTLNLSLELPVGKDSASLQIRDSLIADFVRSASDPGYSEDGMSKTKPFNGDKNDAQSLVDYYGKAAYNRLLKLAMSDYNERISYLEEDTSMSEVDKEQIKNDVPMWAFDLNVRKTTDTPTFVIYDSQSYCYYGGAHGGVIGTGAMTFDKASGKKIKRFIKGSATTAIQPLIRKGLLQYYSEAGDKMTDAQLSERLQIEGTTIPLPQRAAFPNATADSLIFTYGQYEIACYADGMPEFKLAVKNLLPYLTEEGKKLLDINPHH